MIKSNTVLLQIMIEWNVTLRNMKDETEVLEKFILYLTDHVNFEL